MPSRAISPASRTPLAHSALQVHIDDLVAECELLHRFRNSGSEAIEAIYTFPLPLDAAFLGLRATLAGQVLDAQVQMLAKAERCYDDAIADGDSAVLLTQPEPGVLCVSLGNLKPGESGEIVLRFVTPLRVADAQARFALPLVHRPRYGNWCLDDLAKPDHSFAVEHPLEIALRVRGLLGSAHGRCLSQPAQFVPDDSGQALVFRDALLDGDFVVVFELASTVAPVLRCIADGDHTLGCASLVVPREAQSAQALDLVLLLDGSGSMQGDAIRQSRTALRAITRALTPEDRIQVIRFGSRASPLFRRPLKATPAVCAALGELEAVIQADLGGTEMGSALELALRQLPDADDTRRRALILVTDGAVQPADVATAKAALEQACVPVFVVAVGSSAGVEVLQPLATATQAALERAVPLEPIDACVMRQFQRARSAAVTALAQWSGVDAPEAIAMPLAFPGDVLHVAARWAGTQPAALRVQVGDAPVLSFATVARTESVAQRALLGLQRHATASAEARAAIALHYGLLTRETAAVLVHRRADDDRVQTLPEIVKVPQMLTRGIVATPCGPPVCAAAPAPAAAPYPAVDRGRRESAPRGGGLSKRAAATAMRALPAFSAEQVLALLLDLHRVLRAALLAEAAAGIRLADVLQRLPEAQRGPAQDLLQACGLWQPAQEARFGVALLLALAALPGMPALDDDEELQLALLQARHGSGHIDASVLENALRHGVAATEVPLMP